MILPTFESEVVLLLLFKDFSFLIFVIQVILMPGRKIVACEYPFIRAISRSGRWQHTKFLPAQALGVMILYL